MEGHIGASSGWYIISSYLLVDASLTVSKRLKDWPTFDTSCQNEKNQARYQPLFHGHSMDCGCQQIFLFCPVKKIYFAEKKLTEKVVVVVVIVVVIIIVIKGGTVGRKSLKGRKRL